MAKWDKNRTYQMSVSFGLTSGFLCHFWYNFLDRVYPGKGLKIVCKKIAIDQLVFSPVCIATCLVVACILKSHDSERTLKEVMFKGKSLTFFNRFYSKSYFIAGPQLFLAECLLWPPAQFVNFYFLPTRYRVLYDNTVSLLYDVYTSYVQHQPCCD